MQFVGFASYLTAKLRFLKALDVKCLTVEGAGAGYPGKDRKRLLCRSCMHHFCIHFADILIQSYPLKLNGQEIKCMLGRLLEAYSSLQLSYYLSHLPQSTGLHCFVWQPALGMGFPHKLILLRTRSRWRNHVIPGQWDMIMIRIFWNSRTESAVYTVSYCLCTKKETYTLCIPRLTLETFGSNLLRVKPVSEGRAEMHEHLQTTGHIHKTWHVRRSFRSNPLAVWKIRKRHAWVCYHIYVYNIYIYK